MNPASRTRTYSWGDPLVSAEAGKSMSGLEFLQAVQEGRLNLPPIFMTLGMIGFEIRDGYVDFTVEPQEYHYNPIGVVHGGVAATLLDSAMGCAIHSTLEAGIGYTTLELKINYIRPLTMQTGVVHGVGTVIHRGGQIATAEGKVVDAAGKLYAHATTTCLLFRF
jgi:uncharacterized protein (TIGR00369 family)